MGETADIAAGNNFGTAGDDGAGLFFAELVGDLRLIQVVGARAAAAKMGVKQFDDLGSGNCAEQRTWFSAHSLSICEMAGVMICDASWDVGCGWRLAQSEAL